MRFLAKPDLLATGATLRISDNSLGVATHDFLAVLIRAYKARSYACVLLSRLKLNDRYHTLHGVAGKHGPMELKLHFPQ